MDVNTVIAIGVAIQLSSLSTTLLALTSSRFNPGRKVEGKNLVFLISVFLFGVIFTHIIPPVMLEFS